MANPMWEAIMQGETAHGRQRIMSAPWLDWSDWDHDTIITSDRGRVRLVLLTAAKPGNGAFTRLVGGISSAGLQPVAVEPNDVVEQWCERHGWRSRIIGHGDDRQRVFHPRQR